MAEGGEQQEPVPTTDTAASTPELRCPDGATPCATCEPPPKRWRDRWPRPLRWVANKAWLVPDYPPARYPQCILELRRRLQTKDPALASELLADAESLTAEVEERILGVQQRAATLQGAAAIAATVALAGAGLTLDTTKVPQHDWRLVFTIGLGLLVALLTFSAFRALGASSRAFTFWTPSDEDIFERAKLSAAEAMSRRAAYLLNTYGVNEEVAALKVGYLKAAAFWFRWALVTLVLLMVAFILYASRGSSPASASRSSSCSLRDVKLSLGPLISPNTGEHADQFVLRGRNTSACALDGYPHVTLSAGTGRLAFVYVQGGSLVSARKPQRVSLAPGHRGYFLLAKHGCHGGVLHRATLIEVSFPGAAGSLALKLGRQAGGRLSLCRRYRGDQLADPGNRVTISPVEATLTSAS